MKFSIGVLLGAVLFGYLADKIRADELLIQGSDSTLDATIFSEEPTFNAGEASQGRAGRTATNVFRRYLLRFDISAIPQGATITGASLSLRVANAPNANPTTQTLHRITRDWVEGSSTEHAGSFVAGAASWNSAREGVEPWASPGGDFVQDASASGTFVTGTGTDYAWSSPGLAADIQAWVDGAAPNYGWILIGDETMNQTARSYFTAEALSDWPRLLVQFSTPSEAKAWELYD